MSRYHLPTAQLQETLLQALSLSHQVALAASAALRYMHPWMRSQLHKAMSLTLEPALLQESQSMALSLKNQAAAVV